MIVQATRPGGRFGPVVAGIAAVAAGAVVAAGAGQPLLGVLLVAVTAGLFALRSFTVATVMLLLVVVMRLSEVGARVYGMPTFEMPLAVGLLVLVAVSGERRDLMSSNVVRLGSVVIAYLAASLASTLVAGDQARALRVIATTVRDLTVAAALVVVVTNLRRLHAITWTIVAGGGLIGLLGVVQQHTNTLGSAFGGLMGAQQPAVIGGVDSFELAGPENSPNFLGRAMAIVTIIALERLLHSRTRVGRLVAAGAVAACATTLFYTYSRGALVALAVGVVVLLFGAGRRQRQILVVGLVAGAMYFVSTQPAFVEHLVSIAPGAEETIAAQADPSVEGRTSEYTVAVDMWIDHPVLGVGRKNFDRLYQQYSIRHGTDDRAGERNVPNAFLEALAELGTVGFLTFAAIPVVTFVRLRRAKRRFHDAGDDDSGFMLSGAIAALATWGVDSMFESGRSLYWLWLLVAFGIAADCVSRGADFPLNSRSASSTVALSNSATGTA